MHLLINSQERKSKKNQQSRKNHLSRKNQLLQKLLLTIDTKISICPDIHDFRGVWEGAST
jgi:hypothetical protein